MVKKVLITESSCFLKGQCVHGLLLFSPCLTFLRKTGVLYFLLLLWITFISEKDVNQLTTNVTREADCCLALFFQSCKLNIKSLHELVSVLHATESLPIIILYWRNQSLRKKRRDRCIYSFSCPRCLIRIQPYLGFKKKTLTSEDFCTVRS